MPSGCLRVPARACTGGDSRRRAGWRLGIFLRLVRDVFGRGVVGPRIGGGDGTPTSTGAGTAGGTRRRVRRGNVPARLFTVGCAFAAVAAPQLEPLAGGAGSGTVGVDVAARGAFRCRPAGARVEELGVAAHLALPMEYLCSVGVVAPPAQPLRDGPVEGVLAGYRRYLVMVWPRRRSPTTRSWRGCSLPGAWRRPGWICSG